MRAGVLAALLAACTGHYTQEIEPIADAGGSGCAGALFDSCTSAAQCESGLCKTYAAAGFTVCTEACTVKNAYSCPPDATGSAAFCNNMGLCKPAKPNGCTP